MSTKLHELWQRVDEAVQASGQKDVHVEYSAYKSAKNGDPIDNLDEVAVAGKVILVGYADEFYGGPKSKTYRSPVLVSPTWMDVCIYANKMIRKTRDHHHVFLEGLDKPRFKEPDVDGAVVLEFCMGS